jgi:hypothetical protein
MTKALTATKPRLVGILFTLLAAGAGCSSSGVEAKGTGGAVIAGTGGGTTGGLLGTGGTPGTGGEPQFAGEAGISSNGGSGGSSPIDAPVIGGQGGFTELTCVYKGITYPYRVTWKDDDNICWCDAVGGGGGLYATCVKPSSGDGGPSLGCDTVAAERALSAMGIVPLGGGTISSATLPSDLASDPNWGVKDTECREGGYDLSPVAGKMVCLISFPTTETCQQLPAQVWVVMLQDAVHCIYKSAALTPGIYSVHDSLCSWADAGTPPCPGPNPAERTCKDTTSECIPSICTCGSPGSPNDWRCTTDCQTLLLCPPDAGTVDML